MSRIKHPRHARRRRTSSKFALSNFGKFLASMETRWDTADVRNDVTVYDEVGEDITALLVKDQYGPVSFEAGGSMPAELSLTESYYLSAQGADVYAIHNTIEDARDAVNEIALAAYNPVTNTLTVGRDLSVQGLIDFLKQGVSREAIKRATTASPDLVFGN